MKNINLALRGGGYSLAVTAVVLAIPVVVNIFVSAIPVSYTKLDISSSQLYSITSNTKVVVKKNPDVFPTFAEQYTSETVLS